MDSALNDMLRHSGYVNTWATWHGCSKKNAKLTPLAYPISLPLAYVVDEFGAAETHHQLAGNFVFKQRAAEAGRGVREVVCDLPLRDEGCGFRRGEAGGVLVAVC